MDGDDAKWYQAVEDTCNAINDCYAWISSESQPIAGGPGTEQSRQRQLRSVGLVFVNAALQFCDLHDQRPRPTPASRELYEADLQRNPERMIFWELYREQPSEKWDMAQRNLKATKQQLEAEQRADNPSMLVELLNIDVGPAIFRVCCMTVVGAAVGAPLGALAIHESVLAKMTEAAITGGVSQTVMEIVQPVSGALGRRTSPADPITIEDLRDAMLEVQQLWQPAVSVLDVLHQSDEPGGLPGLDELPPEPPDREPPSEPKEPGGL